MNGFVGQTQAVSMVAATVVPRMLHCEKAHPVAILSRSLVQMNLLPTGPDMRQLYTEKFLPEAS